jgi:methyl-accepting chemotaxis protein
MIAALRKPFGAPALDYSGVVDALPSAVMVCDIATYTITYANPASIELLKSIEHLLKIKARDIVGQSIDVFHRNAQHQRKMLADPRNLPHTTRIKLGDEHLSLHISPMRDKRGTYTHAILTWNVVTAEVEKQAETDRLIQMIDDMPINVMTCDPKTWVITYANKTSIETLRRIEQYLPIKASQLIGSSIDVFHKRPQHQHQMLADASRLPHMTNIKVGPETLNLKVSAIRGPNGEYVGPMLTWSLVTEQVKLATGVNEVVGALSSTSTQMSGAAAQLGETATRAQTMASTVSAATEEMAASINEIASNVHHASRMSRETSEKAATTDSLVQTLAEAAEQIGSITNVIETIAGQTNLLALNATIEAARAGEAGRGFAVVASEVKALANQTASATNQIKSRIDAIQGATGSTVAAIRGIATDIGALNDISTQIAAAVEEQSAAIAEITSSMNGVSDAARETSRSASEVAQVARSIDGHSHNLGQQIKVFTSQSTT